MLAQLLIRPISVFLFDVLAAALAWGGAYLLRFNFSVPPEYAQGMWWTAAWAVPLQAMVFRVFGLYRGIWRFASLPDLFRIARAIGFSALLVPVGIVLLQQQIVVPRSTLVLQPILLLMLMGGSRAAYRAWKEHRLYGAMQDQGKPVLVLGAGVTAVNLIRDLSRTSEWRVIGLLDDDTRKHKRTIQGLKILGPLDSLEHFAREMRVKHAIVAMPVASHVERRRAVSLCVRAGVKALTVPSFDDLMSGRVTVSKVRQVEVEDLLGRDPVSIDTPLLNDLLRGRAIMVTGAGGSIGSELCRQIVRFRPGMLLVYEQNEYFLYQLVEELHEHFPDLHVVPVAGDVKDGVRVRHVMQTYSPTVVFHAAAYKHVPLMEEINAWEAVRNNVLGTYVVAKAAISEGVGKFVLVSTDKAVNPTNVMGASKRMAEMVCQSLQQGAGATKFEMVRFGNVLGSAGSVIPKFQQQIARGGPVTVTHPEITRYFMSIPEAAQLVLQAGCMGQGGEIFVMDMGEPVRIADLARDMIRLCGLSEEEIKVVFTGLRPGEKLYEELLADDEQTRPTTHPKLRIAKAREVETDWLGQVVDWLRRNRVPADAEVRRDLKRWVPEYAPAVRTNLHVVSSAPAEQVGASQG